jgi:hypothetical protein
MIDFDTTPSTQRGAPKVQPDTLPGPTTASSSSRKHYLWSLSFYAQAFDVDTNEVLRRCTSAIYPRANFLDVLEGNPDLYGPVWIATTVVVILFLTGTINQYLAQRGVGKFVYDFKLLSGAAGLVYGYTAIVPVGLWAVLKWFGSESANLLECACLYGYANLVWIVVALVSWSPISSKFLIPLSVPSLADLDKSNADLELQFSITSSSRWVLRSRRSSFCAIYTRFWIRRRRIRARFCLSWFLRCMLDLRLQSRCSSLLRRARLAIPRVERARAREI